MGRRSVNTTKSGKFMNPTDQARKIARRKELKKNKKQRNEVRMAVLKSKDPRHLLDEMEQIDLIEFNPRQAPQLNERVLKEKRRKLKETFERVFQMYEREDPDLAVDLKKSEVEYEKLRAKRQLYYEQVKNAERVNIDMIPLPEAPGSQATASSIPPPKDIPLPKSVHGILKRTIGPQMLPHGKLTAPGHPPGPPPSLSDDEDDNEGGGGDDDNEVKEHSHGEDEEESEDKKAEESESKLKTPTAKKRTIRFEDDDDEDGKDTRSQFKSPAVKQRPKDDEEDKEDEDDGGTVEGEEGEHRRFPPPGLPPLMYRIPPPMLPPGMLPPRMRPPPGLPPPRSRPPVMMPPPGLPPSLQPGILSAPPTFNKSSPDPQSSAHAKSSNNQSATISAKPKIRSLIGDATRFTPLSVKVRREVRDARGNIVKPSPVTRTEPVIKVKVVEAGSEVQDAGTDDAYDSFMKEMQGFL